MIQTKNLSFIYFVLGWLGLDKLKLPWKGVIVMFLVTTIH